MADVVRIEQGFLKRMFEIQGISVETEEVVHLVYEGRHLVSLHPKDRYAEFGEDFRDLTNQGEGFMPFLDYLQREEYDTNLK
ncbi:MAG: hypothetical protein HY513_00215 [Candidatus Aenigmarchaeota archaeon]|nr:hypothetical protein [Candidatus Aenigmarchaeota archaeon]